jgi:hypothetical protein
MRSWGVPLGGGAGAPGAAAAAAVAGMGVGAGGGVAGDDAGAWEEGGAALTSARAAAAAAAAQWSDDAHAAWPLQPLATDPANGYMWADFIVDQPLRLIYNQPGRGLAYGLKLTDAVLKGYGLVGVFRAHQHNNARDVGPMLNRVLAGRGAYVNWGGTGHVTTLLSGAGTVGFERDAHALLRVPGWDPTGWALSLCGNDPGEAVGAEAAAAAVGALLGGGAPAGGGCAGTFGAASAPPAQGRFCDATHEFQCSELPWHPAALP